MPQLDQPTRSIAPRDVDNHLYTGAVHKEAESEQEKIARMLENNQLNLGEIGGHKAMQKAIRQVGPSPPARSEDLYGRAFGIAALATATPCGCLQCGVASPHA